MAVKPTYQWQCPRCGYMGPTLEVPVIHVSHDCTHPQSRKRRDLGIAMAQLPLTPGHESDAYLDTERPA